MGENYGRAVIDGKLIYTSVSALNKFADCNRKWWFRYGPMHLPDEEPGRSMLFGTGGHKRIEIYVKTGENLLGPAERAAGKGLELIGPPATTGVHRNERPGKDGGELWLDVISEGKVTDGKPLMADGVPLKGGMDLADPRRLESDGLVVVTDWKFKGDINRTDLPPVTPETLVDPNDDNGRQLLGYMEWVRLNPDLFPGLKWLQARQVHFQTGRITPQMEAKGPFDAKEVVSERVPLDAVAEAWQTVSRFHTKSMKVAAEATRLEDVEPNTNHCRKYNKDCPFLKHCPEGQVGALGVLFGALPTEEPKESDKMNLMDRLNKLNAPANAPPPPPPSPSPVGDAVKAFGEALRGIKPLIEDQSTTPDTDLKALKQATGGRTFKVGAWYRHSDGSTGQLIEVKGVAGVFKMSGHAGPGRETLLSTLGEEVAPINPPDAAKPEAGTPVVVTTTEEVPKKRGRKSNAEKAAEVVAAVAAQAPVPVPTPSPAVPVPVVEQSAKSTLVSETRLYFGCSPVGAPTKTLHAYVEELEAKIVAAFKLPYPDVRLADHEQLKFMKWKAVLARLVKEHSIPPGHYLVTYGDDRIEAVAEALAGSLASIPGAVTRGGGR